MTHIVQNNHWREEIEAMGVASFHHDLIERAVALHAFYREHLGPGLDREAARLKDVIEALLET